MYPSLQGNSYWDSQFSRSAAVSTSAYRPKNRYAAVTELRAMAFADARVSSMYYPFHQASVDQNRHSDQGSAQCGHFHSKLGTQLLKEGPSVLEKNEDSWRDFLLECVREFDQMPEDRGGSFPLPLFRKTALAAGINVVMDELPVFQPAPDSDELRKVPISSEPELTEALEYFHGKCLAPYLVVLTLPKSVSGAYTFGLYVPDTSIKVIDTHPKNDPHGLPLGMCVAVVENERFDLVAGWICSVLAPAMDCRLDFEFVSITLATQPLAKRARTLPASFCGPSANVGQAASVQPVVVGEPMVGESMLVDAEGFDDRAAADQGGSDDDAVAIDTEKDEETEKKGPEDKEKALERKMRQPHRNIKQEEGRVAELLGQIWDIQDKIDDAIKQEAEETALLRDTRRILRDELDHYGCCRNCGILQPSKFAKQALSELWYGRSCGYCGKGACTESRSVAFESLLQRCYDELQHAKKTLPLSKCSGSHYHMVRINTFLAPAAEKFRSSGKQTKMKRRPMQQPVFVGQLLRTWRRVCLEPTFEEAATAYEDMLLYIGVLP
jgi:hypothetical protein